MPLPPIDATKSLAEKRLVFSKTPDRFETSFSTFLFLFILAAGIFSFFKTDFSTLNGNERWYYGCFAILPFVIAPYVLFRLATERKLYKITTGATAEKNRQFLDAYAKEFHYEIHHPSRKCVVLADDASQMEGQLLVCRYYIFLLEDSQLYFCSYKFHHRLRTPSLFHHWIILRDIKKRIRKRDSNF